MEELIAALIEIQENQDLSNPEFANFLEIAPSQWYYVRNRKNDFGKKTLNRLYHLLPELTDLIDLALSGERKANSRTYSLRQKFADWARTSVFDREPQAITEFGKLNNIGPAQLNNWLRELKIDVEYCCKLCGKLKDQPGNHAICIKRQNKTVRPKPEKTCNVCGISEKEARFKKGRRLCGKCAYKLVPKYERKDTKDLCPNCGNVKLKVSARCFNCSTKNKKEITLAKKQSKLDLKLKEKSQRVSIRDLFPSKQVYDSFRYSQWYNSPSGRAVAKANIHKRRARVKATTGKFTKQEWLDLCAKYGNKCLACEKQTKLTPDHVIPIALGGTNDISNIQPLCLSCNISKHAKHIDYRPKAS